MDRSELKAYADANFDDNGAKDITGLELNAFANAIADAALIKGESGDIGQGLGWSGDSDAGFVLEVPDGAITPQMLGTPYREQLIASRDYYVDGVNGDDDNSGFDSDGAFATIQRAIDVAAGLDLSIFAVVIHVAGGTYNLDAQGNQCKSAVGAGTIEIRGDLITPANVVINVTANTTNDRGAFWGNGLLTDYLVRGFKFTGTLGCAIANKNSTKAIYFGQCEFSTGWTHHIRAENAPIFLIDGDGYTISAGAPRHIELTTRGLFKAASTLSTITLSGTPNFTNNFARLQSQSQLLISAVTISGTATGKKFDVRDLSFLSLAALVPGDVAGTTANGGVAV